MKRVSIAENIRMQQMLHEHLEARGITDPDVLAAFARVRREVFVPPRARARAYDDAPLAIGCGQTISQPYIVALMTQAAGIRPTDRILEVGTGSGYQTAILATLSAEVFTLERIEGLQSRAQKVLLGEGYGNIFFQLGDGHQGWPEQAPFDVILVTAAPQELPEALCTQLTVGGRLIAPVGKAGEQKLMRIIRDPNGFKTEILLPVKFVPMLSGVVS